MKSYFSDRTQGVKIKGSTSKYAPITCGVSQGSVLGPLLFLAFINDIHKSESEASFSLSADDTSLFIRRQENKKTRSKSKYLIREYNKLAESEQGNAKHWQIATFIF